MNSIHWRRNTHMLGIAAAGLLAVAFLQASVALADEYAYVPDPSTYHDSGQTILGHFREGTESWNAVDLTDHTTISDSFTSPVFTTSTFFGLVDETAGFGGPGAVIYAHYPFGFDLAGSAGFSSTGAPSLTMDVLTGSGGFQLFDMTLPSGFNLSSGLGLPPGLELPPGLDLPSGLELPPGMDLPTP